MGPCMKKNLVVGTCALTMAVSVQAKDIVDTAVDAGSFKTLATALGAAGLVSFVIALALILVEVVFAYRSTSWDLPTINKSNKTRMH